MEFVTVDEIADMLKLPADMKRGLSVKRFLKELGLRTYGHRQILPKYIFLEAMERKVIKECLLSDKEVNPDIGMCEGQLKLAQKRIKSKSNVAELLEKQKQMNMLQN